jgi:hypothetical protein
VLGNQLKSVTILTILCERYEKMFNPSMHCHSKSTVCRCQWSLHNTSDLGVPSERNDTIWCGLDANMVDIDNLLAVMFHNNFKFKPFCELTGKFLDVIVQVLLIAHNVFY